MALNDPSADPADHSADKPVAALSHALATLSAELAALRDDVKADMRARIRKQHSIVVALAVLAVVMILGIILSVQTNRIAGDARTTNERMADCTTPGGGCYREGQRRTGEAVGDILKASIYMAECSRLRPGESGPAFDAFLERCVADRLAAAEPTPGPAPGPTVRPSLPGSPAPSARSK
jgi:hypothetical protein